MTKSQNFLKKVLFLLVLQLCFIDAVTAQAPPVTTVLFQNSSQLYKNLRRGNGTYLDALAINGAGAKPGGIAAAGVGLMYLCISDAMFKKDANSGNWQATAGQVIQTLDTFITFSANGKTNAAGMFPRYFDFRNGDPDGNWSYEYSTMDNAIFAMGLVMCKNYFVNDAIDNKVTNLLSKMDYTRAIEPTRIALVLNKAGAPISYTLPFNEYLLVSWLAKNANASNPGLLKSQTFWNKYFANPLLASTPLPRPNYFGVSTLSDNANVWQSSFVPQFCYYFVSDFKNDTAYMNYFRDWLTIDKLFCKNSGAADTNEWGLGAGEIPGGGYSADRVDGNPDNIVSPHIIAGFIPINAANSKATLTYLYNNNRGTYTIPGTTRKVLWRYKRGNPAQDANYIQAIDYSTMLFGLASLTEHLGPNWFAAYNNPTGRGLKKESADVPLENLVQNIIAYPNPFVDAINISRAEKGPATIKIFDIMGKVVYASKINEVTETINLSKELESGIYILELNTNDEYTRMRIVKK